MTLKEHSDFIGRIEAASRTASRVDCGECDATIPDDVPAFVYYDVSVSAFFVVCEECHNKP